MNRYETQSDAKRPGLGRAFAIAGSTVVLTIAIIWIAFACMLMPLPTMVGASLFSDETGTGLTHQECAQVAENVLSFSMGNDDAALPWASEDTPTSLGARSRSHLTDVRAFFYGMLAFAVAASALAVAALALTRKRFGTEAMARSLERAGAISIVLVSLFVAVALGNFDALFGWFHGFFFTGDTWLFPPGSLLIMALPDPFWMFLGGVLASLVVVLSLVCVLLARKIRR